VQIDWPGTALAVAGLASLVYGFSQAEIKGWKASETIGLLVAGAVLLIAFVLVERRVKHPLLPLRIVTDRNRGGAYLAIFLSAVALFGVFLFLTYFLQLTEHYSPVKTGLAFLPLVGALVIASTVSTAVLLPRLGPRPLIVLGLLFGAGGMALLTQLGLHTKYLSGVLPSLLLLGLGLGLVFGSSINTATYGAAPEDAGVASALVNTGQQVGGSIGTALLNTIVASATSSYLKAHGHGPLAVAQSSVHGINVAYTVCVGIFLAAAVITAAVLPRRGPAPAAGEAAPATA
jgi:predicted MFS family arabinose efflux permease